MTSHHSFGTGHDEWFTRVQKMSMRHVHTTRTRRQLKNINAVLLQVLPRVMDLSASQVKY